MAAGSIIIDLLLKTGSFETDSKRAEQRMRDFQKAVSGVASALGINARLVDAFTTSLKAVGAGLAVGLTFDKIKEKIEGAIEATAGLQTLSERTGATVEGLSALSGVAKLSGTGTDELATGLQRLGKSLIEAQNPSSTAAQAFKAIGISIADIKALKPDEAFTLIANRLGGYADGAGKTALAQQLLGKSGANLLPVMANIAALGVYQVKVTKEQAAAAEEYERNLNRLNAAQSVLFKVIATEVTPVLDAFVKTMLELATAHDSVGAAAKSLAADGTIQTWAEAAATAVGFVVDAFDGVKRVVQVTGIALAGTAAQVETVWHSSLNNVSQNLKDLADDAKKDMARILDAPLFSDRLAKQLDAIRNKDFGHEGRNSTRPDVPLQASGSQAEAEALLRKSLDLQLKLIKDFGTQQREAVSFVNKLLDGQYQEGTRSLAEQIDDQRKLREYALKSQLDEQDKIIAAERSFASKALNPKDRADAENRVKEAVEAKKLAVLKSAQEEQLALQTSARDIRLLRDSYDGLRATILSLGGDTKGAATINIDKQVQDAQRLINQAANLPAPQRLQEGSQAATLRAGLEGQRDLSEAQKQYNRLLEQQQNAEQQIFLAAKASGEGEFETLAKVHASRQEAIKQLDEMVDKATELALALGTPESIRFAEQLALQFKKASAEIDPLAARISSVFEDSFGNAFSGFIAGTKSATDAFRDFARNVINEIANIAAKDLARKLFGDRGGSSGLLNAIGSIASLFSGGLSVDTTGAGQTGGISGGTVLPPELRGGRASGGDVYAGGDYIVGERGPERFRPFSSGKIIPNDKAWGGGDMKVIVNAPPGTQVDRQQQTDARTLEVWLSMAEHRTAAGLASGTGPMAKAAKARGIRLDGALPTRA